MHANKKTYVEFFIEHRAGTVACWENESMAVKTKKNNVYLGLMLSTFLGTGSSYGKKDPSKKKCVAFAAD